jgi:hypothetical protein
LPATSEVSARRRNRRARQVLSAVTASTVLVLVTGAGIAAAARPHLPAPPRTPAEHAAIEGFAPYQPQFFCRRHVEPGVKAFEKLVLATYPATGSDGDMRACDVGSSSEHKDGRAWDWAADHRRPKQRADGTSLLHWLFANDKYGNADAMFRRLGLMYVIWDKRIWGAWSRRWEPYPCSGVTACHVNHIHFSFGWAGAERKTSFWTHRTGGVVEPPLPRFTARHGHRTLQVSARLGTATARWLFKGGDSYRVVATGVWHHSTAKGAVSDARCTKTAHGWVPAPGGGLTVSGDRFSGWNEHLVPVHNTGRGCNAANHAYRLVLTPSSSSTVVADLPDRGRGNDSGSVRLRFTRAY